PGNVKLVPRQKISWAGWSQVEATLRSFGFALGAGCRFIATLSGQDYPLWPVSEIDDFFRRNDSSFVLTRELPYSILNRFGGRDRFYFMNFTRKGYHRIPTPVPQRPPHGWRPFFGPAFFCAREDAARRMLEAATDPRLMRYFKRTWLPVEGYAATVIENTSARER